VRHPAPDPGARDLARHDLWELSLERSLRRRAAGPPPGPLRRQGARGAALLAAATLSTTPIALAQTSSAATELHAGSHGSAVRALQRALGVTVDGAFGPQTRAALKRAQRSHGLPATGRLDAATARALGLRLGAAAPRAHAPALDRATIVAAQRKLGITADGIVGPQTRAAVSAFERENGLPVDGRLDTAVLQKLGVGSTTSPAAAPAQPAAGVATAVAAARSKIGSPYQSGATGPSAFDCSGLVVWSMHKAGISLPRTSFDQYRTGTAVSRSQIQSGDLVFFNTAGAGASDVGIATGPTTVVSATTHGVKEHAIFDSYWGSHFVGARRISG
jgi:cell wall-associated NlpC family hydrolase